MVLVTSWLCGRHSPAHGFHHHRGVCSAVASWDIGAWKRWAGRWCSREEECYYWSRCGSRCPCRLQHCLGPRLHRCNGVRSNTRKPHYSRVHFSIKVFYIIVNNNCFTLGWVCITCASGEKQHRGIKSDLDNNNESPSYRMS